ncbi:MAG: filamentous hemagglutinin N-terminal domain-containing protein [Azonexus sp.]|nr:filamentous hemagglutinin N-terminal domain-containing protein [Betaproteobacteria bacterium]MBK8918768.1 filamentous hemagglutinin N-terminal domain-containing protein [Betaproteobacteria bacterium]MBP6034701.1 filamentous hemagglutinin N-terminal domain-containing protein [Azonexus sp.]MBP6905241.1 filamentous hemagglutinin N-terminal domain-containing protein [Azonexus sp.]
MTRLPCTLPALCLALPLSLLGGGAGAATNIVRDGSIGSGSTTALGTSGTVTHNAVTYNVVPLPESYGQRAGANVFHSFSSFSVGSGDGAVFTITAPATNIISRVTGGSASLINGLLGVDPGGTGSTPNLFLINPAGVTFGAGAVVDVPGAFHVSTANYLKFPDGRFYADTTHASTFSSAAPEAFGFLGTTRAWVDVVDGATLSTAAQPLSVVAGDVYMEGGTVASGGGDVRVIALGAPGAREVGISGALPDARGSLIMLSNSLIDGSAPGALHGGDVQVASGTGWVEHSVIRSSADAGTTGDAGSVTVQVRGNLYVYDGASISSSTLSTGNAGSVMVSAGSLTIEGGGAGFAEISSDSLGDGNAGPLSVNVSGAMNVLAGGRVSSDTYLTGRAGDISVTAGSLNVDGQGFFAKISSDSYGDGDAGDIDLNVAGRLNVLDRGHVSSDSYSVGVFGRSGDITITAGSMLINGYTSNNAYVSSDAVGIGDAGSVDIRVSGAMAIFNDGFVSSDTYSTGQAGDVSIQAASLVLDVGGNIRSNALGDGTAGAVDVRVTNDLSLYTLSKITSNAQGFGNAGNVTVRASSLVMGGESRISSDSNGVGDAGLVDVRVTGALWAYDNSSISSNTVSQGRAGDVVVRAGSLALDDSDILSESRGDGDAGSLDVSVTGGARLSWNSAVSSNSYAFGSGGNVSVRAGSLTVEDGSVISSDARADGNAGSVAVRVGGAMHVLRGAQVSSDSYSFGNAGDVTVTAGSLNVDGEGTATYVSSDALGGGDAGSVTVNVDGAMRVASRGSVSSDTYSIGRAGNVTVNAGSLTVDGQGLLTFISSDALGDGDAGSVNVRVGGAMRVLNGGSVSSDTYSLGRAGDVTVNAGSLEVSGAFSRISSKAFAFSAGQTGTVDVTAASRILLADGGSLSIENEAVVLDPLLLTPTQLTVTAPVIVLQDAAITAASSGNVAASDIVVNVGKLLFLDPSAISTSSVDGNGGSISILGPNAFVVLENSQITTSVAGLTGNGGDITIDALGLVLNTGFIQANTAALAASGGDVNINVQWLVPSGNSLFVGGSTPYTFVPGVFGFNVIQAAAPDGVSGVIAVTAPVLDLSGSLTGLAGQAIGTGDLGRSPCRLGAGSSLVQTGRGGFAPSARDFLGADGLSSPAPSPGAAAAVPPLASLGARCTG